mmetsp:Transcript_27747/g.59056  ORF Transcript_27747/g.59056 Transcript_27747/m.59056 type:complete len:249 (-) Transcript_27747:25-771(-)
MALICSPDLPGRSVQVCGAAFDWGGSVVHLVQRGDVVAHSHVGQLIGEVFAAVRRVAVALHGGAHLLGHEVQVRRVIRGGNGLSGNRAEFHGTIQGVGVPILLRLGSGGLHVSGGLQQGVLGLLNLSHVICGCTIGAEAIQGGLQVRDLGLELGDLQRGVAPVLLQISGGRHHTLPDILDVDNLASRGQVVHNVGPAGQVEVPFLNKSLGSVPVLLSALRDVPAAVHLIDGCLGHTPAHLAFVPLAHG